MIVYPPQASAKALLMHLDAFDLTRPIKVSEPEWTVTKVIADPCARVRVAASDRA